MSPHRIPDEDSPIRSWIMGREAFANRMPHHDGIEALWDLKWKIPCEVGVFPFNDGKAQDFEAVIEGLVESDVYPGSDEYTHAFMPMAAELRGLGEGAKENGCRELASYLFLRSAALYRVARLPHVATFPKVTCPIKGLAWKAQKSSYLAAGQTWEVPLSEVAVPHKHRLANEGSDIPIYFRLPVSASRERPAPTIVLLSGLDTYRTDHTSRFNDILLRGWAAIAIDIPGVGDSPADPADPESPDRLWNSLLDWMKDDGRFDMGGVVAWGAGVGGFYSVRIAHTHKDRFLGAVAQGAGCHNFLDRDWLEHADDHEFPFGYTESLAAKFGYEDVDEFKWDSQQKFSLLKNQILDGPSTSLLFVNGSRDGLMPVEDSMMVVDKGAPIEGRIFPSDPHLGPPGSDRSVYPWVENLMVKSGLDVEMMWSPLDCYRIQLETVEGIERARVLQARTRDSIGVRLPFRNADNDTPDTTQRVNA